MIELFFILIAVACVLVLTRDQALAGAVVMIGFLQDPARKLVAGEPVAMSVLVVSVFVVAVFRQWLLRSKPLSEPFRRWSSDMLAPLVLYFGLILLQFLHSFIRFGSPILSTLGLIFYLAPFFAIAVAYHSFNSFQDTRRLLVWFSMMSLVVCATVLLAFNGNDSDLLREVGGGLIIYDQGTVLRAYSGIMRSSEIAGWHMGAGICLLIILVVSRYSTVTTVLSIVAIVLLLAAITVTGRRKMLFQVVLFAALYLPVVRYYQNKVPVRYMLLIVFLVPIAWFAFNQLSVIQVESQFDLYVLRGTSVFGDATERFTSLGLGSVTWALNRFGVWGGGIGVAAQGAQHFGGALAGGASEGGMGKIVSELGVFSLPILIWLAYSLGRHVHRCLQLLSQHSDQSLLMMVGIMVFLLSNVPTFVVASQVYGDVFVLCILGLLTGSLFAIPKHIIHQLESRPPMYPSRLVGAQWSS